MKLSQPDADVFVPDSNLSASAALARTTHLCIAAHQDDIEIMAYHGISECFGRTDKWFSGVVVTNGAGSPRTGLYGSYGDAEMQVVRRREQRKAAYVGDYSIQIQLGHPSASVRDPDNAAVQSDLTKVLAGAGAEVVYLHQPADKHDTHVAVMAHGLKALRALPAAKRPKRVYGCEVWRDLDWLLDTDKQVLDVSAFPNVASSLIGIFDSQISGGKRYDLATIGRRQAHATYHLSHATDKCSGITWAIDLTPMVVDPGLSLVAYTASLVDRFKEDVMARLTKVL
ncbi:MAG TPA: PIG-L family deacetylase [Candidatus Baltobacteraceae bacterium]|nr:PIG-L family deacetylase [Candidatus Baltobacteraceae bacterium]